MPNNPPGLMTPTVVSYPVGANSPATAAKLINDANNQKLQNINQMAAGSKRRRGGANATVSVPVIKPIYPEQNGRGTDTTSQQANISKYSMQGSAWSASDNHATLKGGSRRKYKRGGNPDWVWGCKSGGRRTKRRKSRRKRSRRHK